MQLKKSEDLKKEAEEMTRSAKAYVKNARNEAEKAKKDAAREIEKANRRADAAEKDRDIKIAEVESRCKRDNDAASQARQQAEKLQKSYQELIDNEKSEIDKAATKKIEQNFNNMRKREKDYKESVEKHYSGLHVLKESWYVGIMTFCILWLVVLFCTNTYMISCVTQIAGGIKDYVVVMAESIGEAADTVGSLFLGVPNSILAQVLYAVFGVIIGILLFFIFYFTPVICVYLAFKYYLLTERFDNINRWIMVGSGILFVSEAYACPELMPKNILIWWMLLQVVVPVIRWAWPLIMEKAGGIKTEEKEEKKKPDYFPGFMVTFGLVLAFLSFRYLFEQ